MLREVRGDLDWIVMKSLEKDRTRRYETASGLAEDVRRHLGHEPILARGPGTTYRLRKFLRRHQVQVLATLAVMLVAGAATVVLSLWNQDRLQLAETEGFRHRGILSQAQGQYANADRTAVLETIRPILHSRHVGPEARLFQAGILVGDRQSQQAMPILNNLLQERPEVAGAAHALLARILWETGPLDAEKLKEIEEHRRKAEALLPATAEAHFLRAMTAPTVKEQFAALDQTLELDSKHYEARRLRAFTYYASRKYGRLSEDASVMQALRDHDPLGYSLRATALRELGRYTDALADCDKAMSLIAKEDARYFDLATQRLGTLLRMGDYQRIAEDAEEYLKSWPNRPVLQYYIFCALTARGDYEKADGLSRQIISAGPEARRQFQSWCTKYVFDLLHSGRSWHWADREPVGATFLPLREAEETYRDLSAKARCLIEGGFGAQWSPDGKKLAFSLGVRGYSGVAVFDLATEETDLLIVPGEGPRWSPDGRYIVFLRDREFVRIPEFVAPEPEKRPPPTRDSEVWLMNSDGTEPRRLVQGYSPSWSRDSTRIYYHSPLDHGLYSIPIAGSGAETQRIMTYPGFATSVSPDNRQVAYFCLEDLSVRVHNWASQTTAAKWPAATLFGRWSAPTWSPRGDELCLGGSGGLESRTGLWIYRLPQSEPIRILAGPITDGSWAPDGTKLVFELGAPQFGIWAADLDPKISTVEALGPGRTIEEHFRQLVESCTRRIAADPADAQNYLRRAELYQHLHEDVEMRADIRRHNALLRRGFASDSGFRGPWTIGRLVNGPLGYQFVVFLERQENRMHVLRMAFGQKGRCEMKSLEIPVVLMSFLGFCLVGGLDTPAAQADFVFGPPVNLGPTINSGGSVCAPCLSFDGLELYFQRGEPGDMCVSRRPTPDSDWGAPVNFGPTVNTPGAYEGGPSISADGLSLYYGSSSQGLFVMKRATVNDDWGTPVKLGIDGYGVSVSADELELYFGAIRGYGGWDVWVTTRATVHDNWGPPVNVGLTINTSSNDNWPGISPDGLLLFFGSDRPGGSGSWDLYVARRATTKDPWGPPVNLGPVVNSTTWETGPKVSPDGTTLYWHSPRPGCLGLCDIWKAPIIRVVDFDGDGKVDAKDMSVLTDNWGKNKPLCDIGPFAWGDGIVDEKDLGVLMESLVTPTPKASDVPCDVILNWISPSFASACDVYLGTSQEAVSTANRANPQNVLVSQGQAAATYDPPGLLELSQTYYWRVDFMVPGPAPTTVKGPVLKFTTAALTYPIKNITAKASSTQSSSDPEKTVDGSGLNKSDGHSTDQKDMWWSQGVAPHWIQYEFDKVYTLHEMWVWNFNSILEPFMGFGAKTVKIEYSTDGIAWTALANVPEFAKASGKPGYTANTIVYFAGVPAKFVKLTIEKNWSSAAPQTGLSEVRFYCIQSAAAR